MSNLDRSLRAQAQPRVPAGSGSKSGEFASKPQLPRMVPKPQLVDDVELDQLPEPDVEPDIDPVEQVNVEQSNFEDSQLASLDEAAGHVDEAIRIKESGAQGGSLRIEDAIEAVDRARPAKTQLAENELKELERTLRAVLVAETGEGIKQALSRAKNKLSQYRRVNEFAE